MLRPFSKTSALAAAVLLTGCAGAPEGVPQPEYVQKPFTADVNAVRALVTPETNGRTVGEVMQAYPDCEAPSRLWEELEPGSVEFSCRLKTGGLLQFYFKVEAGAARLDSVVFTTMPDAEFAGISLRNDDAREALRNVTHGRAPA